MNDFTILNLIKNVVEKNTKINKAIATHWLGCPPSDKGSLDESCACQEYTDVGDEFITIGYKKVGKKGVFCTRPLKKFQ